MLGARLLTALLLAAPAAAQDVVDWPDAASCSGRFCSVRGTVVTQEDQGPVYRLYFDPTRRDVYVTLVRGWLVTWPSYVGHPILATGKVDRFRDHVEVLVRDPSGIAVLDASPTPTLGPLPVIPRPANAAPAAPPPTAAAPAPAAPAPPPAAPPMIPAAPPAMAPAPAEAPRAIEPPPAPAPAAPPPPAPAPVVPPAPPAPPAAAPAAAQPAPAPAAPTPSDELERLRQRVQELEQRLEELERRDREREP